MACQSHELVDIRELHITPHLDQLSESGHLRLQRPGQWTASQSETWVRRKVLHSSIHYRDVPEDFGSRVHNPLQRLFARQVELARFYSRYYRLDGTDGGQLVQGARFENSPSVTSAAQYQGLPKDEITCVLSGWFRQLTFERRTIHVLHLHAVWHTWCIAVLGRDVQQVPLQWRAFGRRHMANRLRDWSALQPRRPRPQLLPSRPLLQVTSRCGLTREHWYALRLGADFLQHARLW